MEQFLLLPSSKYEELIRRLELIKLLLKEIQNGNAQIEGWLTKNETRKFLGAGATTLWSLRKKNKLGYSKIGVGSFIKLNPLKGLWRKMHYLIKLI